MWIQIMMNSSRKPGQGLKCPTTHILGFVDSDFSDPITRFVSRRSSTSFPGPEMISMAGKSLIFTGTSSVNGCLDGECLHFPRLSWSSHYDWSGVCEIPPLLLGNAMIAGAGFYPYRKCITPVQYYINLYDRHGSRWLIPQNGRFHGDNDRLEGPLVSFFHRYTYLYMGTFQS
jgi:hypothetical protein